MADKATGALLVGSVPLESSEQVFDTMSQQLGDRLKRIPDGETGPRYIWIGWQLEVLAKIDGLEHVPSDPDDITDQGWIKVSDGVDPKSIKFDNLGYADEAIKSWKKFKKMQDAGEIPATTRFQVSIPPPIAIAAAWFHRDFDALSGPFVQGIFNEVKRICAAVPHDKLAIQWDVCVEVWWIEGWLPVPFDPVLPVVVEQLTDCAKAVPDGVELGFHFCYGDYGHRHLKEPDDIQACVDIWNGIAATITRKIDWAHFPVPIERDDDAYFRPLTELTLRPETEIFIGLIHFRDGVEGAERRIATARKFIDDFGVATECGMGRREEGRGGSKDELIELLKIHAAVSDPVI